MVSILAVTKAFMARVRVGCACLFLSACRDTCSYHAVSVPSGSCESLEDTVLVPAASTVLGTYTTLSVTE